MEQDLRNLIYMPSEEIDSLLTIALHNFTQEIQQGVASLFPVPPKQKIDPREASSIYEAITKILEEHALDYANRFSSAAWLWYLRRVPLFFFEGPGGLNGRYNFSDLAEALSSHSTAGENHGLISREPLNYETNLSVLHDITQYCAIIHVLRIAQRRLRTAGKGVAFIGIEGKLPEPAPTSAQKEALAYYDSRFGHAPFLTRCGTPISRMNHKSDTFLVALKNFSAFQTIPKNSSNTEFERLITTVNAKHFPDSIEVPLKFEVFAVSLDELAQFAESHLDNESRNKAALLMVILYIAKILLLDKNPIYGCLQVGIKGYMIEKQDNFLKLFGQYLKIAREKTLSLIPSAEIPKKPEDIIHKASSITQPTIVGGTVFRQLPNSILLDVYQASKQLDRALSFINVPDTSKPRANHFEDRVQEIIDNSIWSQGITDCMRQLRLRKHIKKQDGSSLTDIDALAAYNGVLLLISCKSMVVGDALGLGSYNIARNRAFRVEYSVREYEKHINYLRENPVGPGSSYDFSKFKKIVSIVCTPSPVYTELELARAGQKKSDKQFNELRARQEVLPGLPAAVSLIELQRWLDESRGISS